MGTGYVGLSLAVLISRKYPVVAIDIVAEKVDMINSKKSPIMDKEISEYLSSVDLQLCATTDIVACAGSDYVIVATPTNYDSETHMFDTSSVESVINQICSISPNSTIVIKSTVPIGYTKSIASKLDCPNILFSPEFLREGRALYDNLHPSRIIVGTPTQNDECIRRAKGFIDLLLECSIDDAEAMLMGSSEAESVKLFSNTYLAMRVSFFNELDTFAERNDLDSKQIIDGVCLDTRIGKGYNNPSFGYGGYCLPKDTKQLLANYETVPNCLIEAIVKSNDIRKEYIASIIKKRVKQEGSVVGVYRLIMKTGSDNFRDSSVFDIMDILSECGNKIIVYEPTVLCTNFDGWEIENDFNSFVCKSDVIIANRMSSELLPHIDKVVCRDLFNCD